MMTREESMIPREAYDTLERKCTLRFDQGQPENEETDDKDVDITVRTTATEPRTLQYVKRTLNLTKQTIPPVKPNLFPM